MISIEKFNRGKNKEIRKYYIAYGSNMDLNQMSYRCPDSKYIGVGYIEGYRLEFRERYATIEPEEGSRVPVVIFGITEEDEERLDRYEGYPELYYKEKIRVRLRETFTELEGMVYIMERGYRYRLPEVSYYENMEYSYKNFGFEIEILERGLIDSYKKVEREKYILIQNDFSEELI